jgi:hypothetical protein
MGKRILSSCCVKKTIAAHNSQRTHEGQTSNLLILANAGFIGGETWPGRQGKREDQKGPSDRMGTVETENGESKLDGTHTGVEASAVENERGDDDDCSPEPFVGVGPAFFPVNGVLPLQRREEIRETCVPILV